MGLPEKNGLPLPLFDYEEDLLSVLSGHKYVWIKKARGLGITEFFLRYVLWLAHTQYRNIKEGWQISIVTGPNLEIAIDHLKRLKTMLRGLGIFIEDKESVIQLERCRIRAFPSGHMGALRGQTNMKFILLDEADFFKPDQQQEAKDVSEGYIPKSDPQIVMISTPNSPGGMFDKIENDHTSQYFKIMLPYSVGLSKIYDPKEIEIAKQFPSFEREYNLKYGYGTGNVLPHHLLEQCLHEFEIQDISIRACPVSVGVDPGWGSSKFAVIVTAFQDDIIKVLEAEEYEHPDFNMMVERVFELRRRYGAAKVYVDGSQHAYIQALKVAINEDYDYERVIEQARHDGVEISDRMQIVPVNFNQDGRKMLGNLQTLVGKHGLWIRPQLHNNLIAQMRMAKEKNGNLDKSVNTMDLFDSLRLALFMYDLGPSRK